MTEGPMGQPKFNPERIEEIMLAVLRRSGYRALTDIPAGRREQLRADVLQIIELLTEGN